MASIKKSTQNGGNLFIICQRFQNKPAYQLSNEQQAFVEAELKQQKKFVVITVLDRLVFVALTDTSKPMPLQLEQLRKHAAQAADALNAAKQTQVSVINEATEPTYSLAVVEGMTLANYQFIKHRANADKLKNSLKVIGVQDPKVTPADIAHLDAVLEATELARDMVNEPVNILNTEAMAQALADMGRKAGFKTEILNKAKIKQLKMGGLLAVNQGSVDPPAFAIMEYKPKNAKNKKPYVLVGKGLVYDTGGLSLKGTPGSMDMMKCDMAGGAAVGGAMFAIAKAKLNVHVIGLVPITDNRPGFNAFAPGDIITMMDGSTVEMLNSDAEGRMVLADALHYAKRYKPELTIDLATLTGAAATAIGAYGIVSMGTASDKQKQQLAESGHAVHERLVEFPFWDEYAELLKSDIADQKNIGGPVGGAITAGKFLEKFTDYPYMHFDIAGPAFSTAKDSYRGKGGTGCGVRLLFDFFSNL